MPVNSTVCTRATQPFKVVRQSPVDKKRCPRRHLRLAFELRLHRPLFAPIGFGRDAGEVLFGGRIATAFDRRQEKKFFLYVWGDMESLHHPGNPRPSDLGQPGKVSRAPKYAWQDSNLRPAV